MHPRILLLGQIDIRRKMFESIRCRVHQWDGGYCAEFHDPGFTHAFIPKAATSKRAKKNCSSRLCLGRLVRHDLPEESTMLTPRLVFA